MKTDDFITILFAISTFLCLFTCNASGDLSAADELPQVHAPHPSSEGASQTQTSSSSPNHHPAGGPVPLLAVLMVVSLLVIVIKTFQDCRSRSDPTPVRTTTMTTS
ncbi:unnamed protein product [Cuscuta epithymum]|uniref:Uncharacterized protein n=1 Tax=Cuscuta epithymum TaxID=186058 RepID=A0AAV0F2M5_9ASTE|nr:unnamed protein product [Cuscuta epithymum]